MAKTPSKSRPGNPSRRIKQANYKSFRLQKRIKHPVQLPSAYRLFRQTAATLWSNKKLFGGLTLVYGLLNLVLVQGLTGGTDVSELKSLLGEIFTGNTGQLAAGIGVFAVLIGSAGNASSELAGAYQMFLGLITTLAVIWALRQVLAGNKVRIRDSYYRGMYPLVPFILVLFVIGLQMVPLLIGASLYSIVTTGGIAIYAAEKFIWALLYGLLALLSLYLVTSSLFALYIVTLPDMTPLRALRSARELVRYRRWTVLRKLLALPPVLLVASGFVMVPIIIWLTPLAEWVFFVLTMLSLIITTAYIYHLYRELLNE